MIRYSRLHNRLQIAIPKICLLVFLTACDGASNQSEYAGENGGVE